MSHTTNLATQIENTLRQVLEAASNPRPTYTDWTQAAAVAGTTLTPQGIEQRFTPEAAHFLYALLQRLVACVVTTCTPAATVCRRLYQGQHGDYAAARVGVRVAGAWR